MSCHVAQKFVTHDTVRGSLFCSPGARTAPRHRRVRPFTDAMWRQAAPRLVRSLCTSRAASAAADEAAASTSAATKAFLEKFTQRAPSTMAPPNFPTDYRACAPPTPATDGGWTALVGVSDAVCARALSGRSAQGRGRNGDAGEGDAELLPAA
jgi:hypothetical protein